MINFPQNPAVGQLYSFGVKSWKWNGRAWDLQTITDALVLRAEAAAQQATTMAAMRGTTAKQAGAKPNVQADQSAVLQAAYDACVANNAPFIIDDVYWIALNPRTFADGLTRNVGLQVKSNSVLVFMPGAALKILPNNLDVGYGINTYLADNFVLWDPVVYGERNQHTGNTGESVNCFNIVNCTRGWVHRPIAYDAWGDGIMFGNEYWSQTNLTTKDVTIIEPRIFNARRNGISMTGGINLYVHSPYIEGIVGTWPQSGMDLEPEGQGATKPVVENWRVTNPRTKNCAGAGINVYTNALAANSNVDIEVTNHHDIGSAVGAIFQHDDAIVTGHVRFLNPVWENNQNNGLGSKCSVNGPRFIADNFLIKNCGNRVPLDWLYASAIGLYRQAGEGTTTMGNFSYRGRVLDTNPANAKKIPFAVFCADDGTNPVNSKPVANAVIELTENTTLYTGRGKFNLGVDATSTINLGQAVVGVNLTRDAGAPNELFTDVVMAENAAANVTFTLGAMRQKLRAFHLCVNYSMVVRPAADARIYGAVVTTVGQALYSNDPGAAIVLHPNGAKDWVAEIIGGNWIATA